MITQTILNKHTLSGPSHERVSFTTVKTRTALNHMLEVMKTSYHLHAKWNYWDTPITFWKSC